MAGRLSCYFINLYSTINYFDSAENYYHGFMTGLIRGAGLSKYARKPEDMEDKAEEALKIEERKYAKGLVPRIQKVTNYGIAFWKKESCIKVLETAR